MKRFLLYLVFILFLFSCTTLKVPKNLTYEDPLYYARCNLKVLEGNFITWVNWQSTWVFVPVGTELKISKGKKYVYLRNKNGISYILDVGNSGDVYLEKFVTRTRPDITIFHDNIQANIRNTVARIGMTKEQVYIAMGPPALAERMKTDTMTYEQIMNTNLWVYKRRKFGKNIGIAFDYETGEVNTTEGIWR
jgi:hypothetical protein